MSAVYVGVGGIGGVVGMGDVSCVCRCRRH